MEEIISLIMFAPIHYNREKRKKNKIIFSNDVGFLILHIAGSQATPIGNKCFHINCTLSGSEVCPSCSFRFCSNHKTHKHGTCCAIDQTVKCKSQASKVEDDYYYCDYHFEVIARAKCHRCSRLQPKHRREYKYCTSCVDTIEAERHGYWYALRQQGISG